MVEPDFTDPPTPTVGELPPVGDPLPEFELIGTDLRQITNETFAGTRLIISSCPLLKPLPVRSSCAVFMSRFLS